MELRRWKGVLCGDVSVCGSGEGSERGRASRCSLGGASVLSAGGSKQHSLYKVRRLSESKEELNLGDERRESQVSFFKVVVVVVVDRTLGV